MSNTVFAAAASDRLLVNQGTVISMQVQKGQAELILQRYSGRNYRIRSSTNPENWTNVLTVTPFSDGL